MSGGNQYCDCNPCRDSTGPQVGRDQGKELQTRQIFVDNGFHRP
jgi:hypothetical protein